MSDPLAEYLAAAPRAATPAPDDDAELSFLRKDADPLARYLADKAAPGGRIFPADQVGTLVADLKPKVPEKPTIGGAARAAAGYVAGAAKAIGKTGLEIATNPAVLADSRARRSALRGIDNGVTLGYGQRGVDAVSRAVGIPENETLAGTRDADLAAYPEFYETGNVAGSFVPGATSLIGKGAAGVVGKTIGKTAFATAGARAAAGAVKGVAGYEAAAPLTAALSADASGHRLEAAQEAATNPAGIVTSGVLGAATEPVVKNLTENARGRATKDIGKDITAAEGPRARDTDQKRIAEVNDRLFDLTQANPELRKIWRQPAEKALPRIETIKKAVAKPLDELYTRVDANTGGGLRLGDVLDSFEAQASEAAKRPSGLEDAARLRKLASQFEKSYGEPAGGTFDPASPINADGMTAGQALAMMEPRAHLPGMAEEIARVRAMATSPGAGINLDRRIPTAEFRSEITNLHKTAEAAMGGLEGTARHEALSRLYQAGKEIIDQHLDRSGLPPAELTQLRRINDQYFLLSRAEAAIQSRGWKESNRPGFHLPHNAAAAVRAGGILAPVGYGIMHPHAIVPMAAAYGVGHAAPALAARANWRLAQLPPGTGGNAAAAAGAGLARLMQAARAGAPPASIISAAQQLGVSPEKAQQIAAWGAAQGQPATPPQPGP